MRPALRGRQAAWLKQIEDVLHPGFLSNRDKFFKIKSQLFQYRFLKTVLPGAPVRPPEEEGEGKSKKRRSNIDDEEDSDQRRAAKHPKETVRTDSKEQKMDRFITRGAFGNDRPQVCHQHLHIVFLFQVRQKGDLLQTGGKGRRRTLRPPLCLPLRNRQGRVQSRRRTRLGPSRVPRLQQETTIILRRNRKTAGGK